MAAVETKAQRWGGSVAALIPVGLARKFHIVHGTPIEVDEGNGAIVIRVVPRKSRSLEERIAACRKKFPKGSPHRNIWKGGPAGREVW